MYIAHDGNKMQRREKSGRRFDASATARVSILPVVFCAFGEWGTPPTQRGQHLSRV